jgi:hypothetical protein
MSSRGRVILEYQRELEAIYRIHCPEKVANIPVLLTKFKGKERQLMEKVSK